MLTSLNKDVIIIVIIIIIIIITNVTSKVTRTVGTVRGETWPWLQDAAYKTLILFCCIVFDFWEWIFGDNL